MTEAWTTDSGENRIELDRTREITRIDVKTVLEKLDSRAKVTLISIHATGEILDKAG